MSTIYEKAARDLGMQAKRASYTEQMKANIVAVEFDASDLPVVEAILDMHPEIKDEVMAIGPDHLLALNSPTGRGILLLLAMEGGVLGYTKFLSMPGGTNV